LAISIEEGMDKFIKALRFMLGKQEHATNVGKYHILLGRLYQKLADLTIEQPAEMIKCIEV